MMTDWRQALDDDLFNCAQCAANEHALNQLGQAVELLKSIANSNSGGLTKWGMVQICEDWLYENGFDCRTKQKRDREKRADELDAQIAKLQAAREELRK